MKVLLWMYAIAGSVYAAMYFGGEPIVTRFAVGPLWATMMAAPIVLGLLISLAAYSSLFAPRED